MHWSNDRLKELAGDYLFSSKDFLSRLSTENRNVFQKVWDEIKYLCKVATAGSKEARELARIEKMFGEVYRESGEAKNTTPEGGVRYSITEIVDENNNSYGTGVRLDSTLLEGLTADERKGMVKERIKELGGEVFTAYDNNGNAVDITIAKPSANFRNHNGKKRPVNKDLTTKFIGDEVKQEAVVLIDELIVTSKFQGTDPAKHKHGWLDNNGQNDWDVWTTYIQDKNNTVWETTLHIANTANGEKIIYDVVPTKKVGQSGNSDTSPPGNIIAQKPDDVNRKNSLSDDNTDFAPMPGEVYGKDIGIDAPVREDLDSENVPDSDTDGMEAFDAMLDEIEIRDTRQRLDAILCMTTKFQIHYETVNFSKNPAIHRIFHLQPLTKWFIIPKSMQK